MTKTRLMPARLAPLMLSAALMFLTALPGARAQNLFAPVAKIGDSVVTGYEVQQRALMLKLLNSPGNPEEVALEQLIDDRLKFAAARRFGIALDADDLAAGKTELAARANLEADQFVKALAQAGVEETTLDAFVASGLVWRQLVRGRFSRFVDVSEQDIDRALTNAPNGKTVRVLISEIFIPAPPGQEAQALELGREISQIRTLDGFAAAARKYSASPSARTGGRVNWMPLSQIPANLSGLILALEPGEVTAPLSVPNAVALFQLRAIEEGAYEPLTVTGIDYAAYYIAGGRSEAALKEAARIKTRVDNCDDLYGIAKGQPETVLDRGSKTPGEIPTDVAYELAKLDEGEVSTALTRSAGQTLVFLMLCKRETEIAEGVDRDAVRTQLSNAQIERLAAGLLEQLRAETRIVIY